MKLPFQSFPGQASGPHRIVAKMMLAMLAWLAGVPGFAATTDDMYPPGMAAASADCAHAAGARDSLARVAQELRDQGMALEANCRPDALDWVVRVRVVDGIRAARTVRGPLADGLEVDMGTPAGVLASQATVQATTGFSPDVQYNRQWLRSLMARHRFENVPRAWWLFAERGASRPTASQLAAR